MKKSVLTLAMASTLALAGAAQAGDCGLTFFAAPAVTVLAPASHCQGATVLVAPRRAVVVRAVRFGGRRVVVSVR
jgi:hypothetical protein